MIIWYNLSSFQKSMYNKKTKKKLHLAAILILLGKWFWLSIVVYLLRLADTVLC